MNTTDPDDTLQAAEAVRPVLLAYIGGRLTPDQRDVFETRMLADDAFSRAVEEAEFALVEDFAADALPRRERFEIEPWITASTARSAQVAIANTLRQRQRPAAWQQQPDAWQQQPAAWQQPAELGDVLPFPPHAAQAPAPAQASGVQSISSRRKVWYILAPLAAAAALVVGVFVVRGHDRPAETASGIPARVQPAAPSTSGGPLAGGIANGLQAGPDTLRLDAQAFIGDTSRLLTPIFHLRAGHPTEFQIAVPPGVAADSFSLSLHAPGRPGLTQDHLRANITDVPPVIHFTLPPNTLAPGHYSGTLRSRAGSFPLKFQVEP